MTATLRIAPATATVHAEANDREWQTTRSTPPAYPGRVTIPMSRTTIGGVTYKIANTRSEREEALRLVYDSYRRSELIPDNPHQMRVTPYHLQPTTDIFIAVHERQIVYTVTLIADGEQGMPLEAIFADEVEQMRDQNLSLAEVSCLAGREGHFDQKQGMHVYINLIGLMLQYSRYNGIDRLLLAVHPRHARYYERFFGCDALSDPREYAAVLGNPAVLCSHDFVKLDQKRYRLYDDIYRLPFARYELCGQPMNAADRAYFSAAVTSRVREFVAVGA